MSNRKEGRGEMGVMERRDQWLPILESPSNVTNERLFWEGIGLKNGFKTVRL